jgi:hypothetical protein
MVGVHSGHFSMSLTVRQTRSAGASMVVVTSCLMA